jgi:SpoVK/Ycf46/Vps4 family AAA+-type ATPase
VQCSAAFPPQHGDIDYEAVVKLSDGFNGADLRNICTEAGLFAIRWALLYYLLYSMSPGRSGNMW